MKVIIITGTPGTGKSFIASRMAKKLGYSHLDITKFVKENRLSEGYDRKRKSLIIDEKRLVNAILAHIKKAKCKGIIIDGHMAHFLPKKIVYKAIVCKTPLKTLKSRLEARKYPASKVRENLDAEIFDICCNESLEFGYSPLIYRGEPIAWLLSKLKLSSK